MSEHSELVGKRAYKVSGGLYGYLIGNIERSRGGITSLVLRLPDGSRLGAFPDDLIVVDEEGNEI